MNTKRIVSSLVVAGMHLAWGRNDFSMSRSFYIPKEGDVEKIDPQGTDLEIAVYERNGSLIAVVFSGKGNKPILYNRFRDRASLDRSIANVIANRKSDIETKLQRREERKNYQHTLKVGDILDASWGYDQTNVNFYQVTEVGEKSVKIREIAQKPSGSERGGEYVVPVPDKFIGPEMLKRVSSGNYVNVSSSIGASPWNGQPSYQTAFGFGH